MTRDVVKPTNNMDEQSNEVVNNPVTTDSAEESVQEETAVAESTEAQQAGNKTPPHLLLKSLQEERQRNRLLEQKLSEFSNLSAEEEFSDEGRALKKEISSLATKITEMQGEITKKDLFIAHPVLKDKWSEFEEFRNDPENEGMPLKTAAKAFLVENGMIGTQRKGLEKPTGGTRTPPTSGMTAEDVRTLRETNFKRYTEMLEKGQLKMQ